MSLIFMLLVLGLIIVVGVLVAVFLINRDRREPAPYTGDLAQDARALVQAGRTIEAIRLVRTHTGVGLAEARDYVNSLEQGDEAIER